MSSPSTHLRHRSCFWRMNSTHDCLLALLQLQNLFICYRDLLIDIQYNFLNVKCGISPKHWVSLKCSFSALGFSTSNLLFSNSYWPANITLPWPWIAGNSDSTFSLVITLILIKKNQDKVINHVFMKSGLNMNHNNSPALTPLGFGQICQACAEG